MVAKKQETALAVSEEKKLAVYGDLMDETPVEAKDIFLPKLSVMQSMSKAVQEEKARVGEIRGSLDNNLLAEKGAAIEFIPFGVFKTWVRFTDVNGKAEYLEQVPYTPENATWDREVYEDGKKISNMETLNYYCLLPEEIKKGEFIPYVLTFRSTSLKVGKKLETFRARLQEFRKPLPFKTFSLSTELVENEKGRWYLPALEQARDTSEEELNAVKHWHNMIKVSKVRVDESDLEYTNAVKTDVEADVKF